MKQRRVRFPVANIATQAMYAFALSGFVSAEVRSQQRVASTAVMPSSAVSESGAQGSGLDARIAVTLDSASFSNAIQAVARQAAVRITLAADARTIDKRVTMRERDIVTRDAFKTILAGTPVQMAVASDGQVLFTVRRPAIDATGIVAGHVIDATTKVPIRGATVLLDGSTKGVRTDDNGNFQLPNVTAGEHRVTVRILGYGKLTKSVTVVTGQTMTVAIALEPSANTLDQIVVTGTVVATELKAVPNAITVITAKDIERRGITRIDQLFRGDVPGLFAQNSGGAYDYLGKVMMFSRGATALGQSNGTHNGTNPIKTYVDGIEMADPAYLSQIDPTTIERIEILTGPQASTIYGSNALNGVMQIFTKRGTTTRPQVTLNLTSGTIENNLSSARAPQHLTNGNVSGIEGKMSYFGHVSWNYTGQWTPGNQTTEIGGSTGLHWTPLDHDALIIDGTFQEAKTQQFVRGGSNRPGKEIGWWNPSVTPGADVTNRYILDGGTVGLTGTYRIIPAWSQTFQIGRDSRNVARRQNGFVFSRPTDTTLYVTADLNERYSLAYNTTLQGNVTSWLNASVTVGGDGWRSQASSVGASSQSLTGAMTGDAWMSRDATHNSGGFLQSKLGILDRLFLTYGVRAEWNPNFGAEATPNVAPQYGLAYSADVGSLTAKVRAIYGRSTRPPTESQKLPGNQLSSSDGFYPLWGSIYQTIANPLLEPERQQGTEFGLDLYWGNRASLTVTRYNQTVNNLIATVPGIDSVKSLMAHPYETGIFGVPCSEFFEYHSYTYCSSETADGYWYRWVSQNANVAGIRNQGWELNGTLTTGPFTSHGTYSWTKSRSLGVTEKFQQNYAINVRLFPQYSPGATPQYVPEHTWAVGTTYAIARASIGIDVNGIGAMRSDNSELQVTYIDSDVRLVENKWRVRKPPPDVLYGYFFPNKGYAMANLTASYRVSHRVEGKLNVQNLTNFYQNDLDARYPVMGRQTSMGLTVRY